VSGSIGPGPLPGLSRVKRRMANDPEKVIGSMHDDELLAVVTSGGEHAPAAEAEIMRRSAMRDMLLARRLAGLEERGPRALPTREGAGQAETGGEWAPKHMAMPWEPKRLTGLPGGAARPAAQKNARKRGT
jgi:hypothetical protein